MSGLLVNRLPHLGKPGLLLIERVCDLLNNSQLGFVVQVRPSLGHLLNIGDDRSLASSELLEGKIGDHQRVITQVQLGFLGNGLKLGLFGCVRFRELINVLELENIIGGYLLVRLLHGLQVEQHLARLLDHVLEAAGHRLSDDSALRAAHRIIIVIDGPRRDHAVFTDLELRNILKSRKDVLDLGQTALAAISHIDGWLLDEVVVVLLVELERLGHGAASDLARQVTLNLVVLVGLALVAGYSKRHQRLSAIAPTFTFILVPCLDDICQEVLLVLADLLNLFLGERASLSAVGFLVDGVEILCTGFLKGPGTGSPSKTE